MTGNVVGQIRCNLHVNIGGFSKNYPGVQPPLRSKPTLVLNLLIKSLVPKTGQNEFSPNNSNTVLHYQEKKLRGWQNDHQWEKVLIFYQILINNSLRNAYKSCSLENLYVDTGI